MRENGHRLCCCFLIVFLMLFTTAISESDNVNNAEAMVGKEEISHGFAELSVDELLELRAEIDVLLEQKGYVVYFDIERGEKGENVSNIQERLALLGYYAGKITGKFDSETQKAFKSFEKMNNITNDGLASRQDQIVLFSTEAIAKPTATPKTYQVYGDGKNSNIEHDSSFDYEDCMRYPSQHMLETYKLKGKVEQTIGNRTSGYQIRFSVLGNSDEIIYVTINSDPGYNILENDWLIIDLTMYGTITYESIWGKQITIPQAFATNVVLR